MKAYIINPFKKTVEQVDYSGHFEEISRFLDCDYFTTVTINKMHDTIFVDDVGLFKDNQAFFQHANYRQPLAGYGLVLGTTSDGESCEPKMSIEELTNDILWVSMFNDSVLFA